MYTDDIKEAALGCSKNEKVIFKSTSENRYKLFLFWFYQMKHGTLNSFNTIHYYGKRGIVFWLLFLASKLSFGYYVLEEKE